MESRNKLEYNEGGRRVPKPMDIEVTDEVITLQRDQWNGKKAKISNFPGLLDEVMKYTWTYTEGNHPYLNSSKLKVSLHKFVLQYLYGKEKLDEMLGESNIIEHLDNDGLNCTYDNLHILSADLNKAKAFTIDKKSAAVEVNELGTILALITDVYYSHKNKQFQLQVFFNKNIAFNAETNSPVEMYALIYDSFYNLYIDWLYCFQCIETESFDITKHHAKKVYEKAAPMIALREYEKDAQFIVRDGQPYLVLRTDPEKGAVTFMNHTARRNIEE